MDYYLIAGIFLLGWIGFLVIVLFSESLSERLKRKDWEKAEAQLIEELLFEKRLRARIKAAMDKKSP